MDSEKVLPRDHRIDPLLEECGDEVRLEIDDRQLGNEEILDPSIELEDYDSFRYFSRFVQHEALGVDDEVSRVAIYRAMVFAYEVTQIIHEENARLSVVSYVQHIARSADREEQLRQDVQYYLADNPNIHDLIQYYLDEIDQGREKPEAIELGAGLVFMLVERNLANHWIHETAVSASPSMFEREG
ncbi:TPA: hypothetical protein DCF80_03080 [Candidatus Saccharibacteria bacterium]|nr:hypothetical protein [Candidatus Saccharibacteria bacterium]HRK40984.1 hypothetical protein [Candidatus Saccharibacteria bacterium]